MVSRVFWSVIGGYLLRLHLARNRALLLSVVLLLSLSMVCLAQESRGSITGKVVDPQNSVIPGAAVVVTNTATNVSDKATPTRRVISKSTF